MSAFRRRNLSGDDSDEKPQRSYRDSNTTKSASLYSRGGSNSVTDRDRYESRISDSKYGSYRDTKISDSDEDNRPSFRRKEEDTYRTTSSRHGASSSLRRPTANRSDDSDDDNKYGSGRRTNALSSRPASSFRRDSGDDGRDYDSSNVMKHYFLFDEGRVSEISKTTRGELRPRIRVVALFALL